MTVTGDVRIGGLVEFKHKKLRMLGYLYWSDVKKYRFKLINIDPYSSASGLYFNNSRYIRAFSTTGWVTHGRARDAGDQQKETVSRGCRRLACYGSRRNRQVACSV